MVLWSEKRKKIILIELTVPWDKGSDQTFERKSAKYQVFLQQCQEKGQQDRLFPVEVDCRGFPTQSIWRMFTAIGLTGKERKAAGRGSCWIWNRREELSWKPGGEDGQ